MAPKVRKTKYEEYALTIRDRKGKPIALPDPKKETILEFIQRAGYSLKELEGGTPLPHEKNAKRYASTELFQRLVRDNEIHTIGEIGFNAGVSAFIFLTELRKKWGDEDQSWFLISFDYGIHPYCFYAKLYIDAAFPNRHVLITGDSKQSVPNTYKFFEPKNPKWDLLFIDGDHTMEGAYLDLVNMKLFASKDTPVILDNTAPHRGAGLGVYLAVKKLFDEDKIVLDEWIELKNYHDAMLVCRYKFEDSEPGKINLDWKKAERLVAVWEATRDYDKKPTQENFVKFVNRITEIIKNNEGEVDDYTKKKIQDEYKRFQINLPKNKIIKYSK